MENTPPRLIDLSQIAVGLIGYSGASGIHILECLDQLSMLVGLTEEEKQQVHFHLYNQRESIKDYIPRP